MTFNKGSELDKQIYPEGEPTWGCKSGVLDVDDVQKFIDGLRDFLGDEQNMTRNKMLNKIEVLAGEKFCT
jgi:hypothetical protein